MAFLSHIVLRSLRMSTAQPASQRDRVADRYVYESLCERALDYLAGGAAQRLHLRGELIRRLGQTRDVRKAADEDLDPIEEVERIETDSGGLIRVGDIEQITVPLVRSIVEDLAATYSADDLERLWRRPGASESDTRVASIIEGYHRRGMLAPTCQRLDEIAALLNASCCHVRWSEPLRTIAYDVVMPHWVHVEQHPSYPLDTRVAFAVAIGAGAVQDDSGAMTGEGYYIAHVRPPLPGDPADAITHAHPEGRTVRYQSSGGPWPIPKPGAKSIVSDGPNVIVEAGGWNPDKGERLWCPLVWYRSHPPTERLHPHPNDDLVQANLELDVALSWLTYVANLQCFGQPVVKGSGNIPEQLGPLSVIRFDEPEASFEFVTPGADLSTHLDVTKQLMAVQGMLRGLAPDIYLLKRPSIQTGPAKRLEQSKLIESRWRRLAMADAWERDRFDLERCLHNAYGREHGASIPPAIEQTVRWGELRVPVDRTEQVQRLIQEMAAGIASRVDAVAEVQGLTRDEAIAHARRVDDDAAPAEQVEGSAPVDGEAPETDGAEQLAKTAELFAKLKVEPKAQQAILLALVRELGVATPEVVAAINSSDPRWYTEVQAAIFAGNDQILGDDADPSDESPPGPRAPAAPSDEPGAAP